VLVAGVSATSVYLGEGRPTTILLFSISNNAASLDAKRQSPYTTGTFAQITA